MFKDDIILSFLDFWRDFDSISTTTGSFSPSKLNFLSKSFEFHIFMSAFCKPAQKPALNHSKQFRESNNCLCLLIKAKRNFQNIQFNHSQKVILSFSSEATLKYFSMFDSRRRDRKMNYSQKEIFPSYIYPRMCMESVTLSDLFVCALMVSMHDNTIKYCGLKIWHKFGFLSLVDNMAIQEGFFHETLSGNGIFTLLIPFRCHFTSNLS